MCCQHGLYLKKQRRTAFTGKAVWLHKQNFINIDGQKILLEGLWSLSEMLNGSLCYLDGKV